MKMKMKIIEDNEHMVRFNGKTIIVDYKLGDFVAGEIVEDNVRAEFTLFLNKLKVIK